MKTSNLINAGLIVAAVVLLTACRNNADANRAVEVFFLGVLQVLNMIFFGICAVVFSIISATNNKQVFKILGWVFLSIFTLFTLIGFAEVQSARPRDNEIYIIFMMELAMIVVSFIFVTRKPESRQGPARKGDLDQSINENEVL